VSAAANLPPILNYRQSLVLYFIGHYVMNTFKKLVKTITNFNHYEREFYC